MKDAITAVSASAFIFSLACGLSFADADTPSTPSLQLEKLVNANLAELVSTYKVIHAHPELSHHEEQPSGLFATELRKAGYAVTITGCVKTRKYGALSTSIFFLLP